MPMVGPFRSSPSLHEGLHSSVYHYSVCNVENLKKKKKPKCLSKVEWRQGDHSVRIVSIMKPDILSFVPGSHMEEGEN